MRLHSVAEVSIPHPVGDATFEVTGGHFIYAGVNDAIFAMNATRTQVLKSTNGWDTSPLFRELTGGSMTALFPIDEDAVLVALDGTDPADDGLYRVTTAGQTRVLEWQVAAGNPGFSYERWPFHGADTGQILLVAEYGPKDAGAYARHLYVSLDEGLTWREIFELPEDDPGNTHLHGPHYDEHTDRVWVCSGDGAAARNVWYSDDWREVTPTWTRVWPEGTAPQQFTSIYAFEDVIVFATDGPGEGGIWAMGRSASEPEPVQPYGSGVTEYVGRNFLPAADGRAVYVWLSKNQVTVPSRLLVSFNGWEWYEIYTTANNVSVIQSALFDGHTVVWQESAAKMHAAVAFSPRYLEMLTGSSWRLHGAGIA